MVWGQTKRKCDEIVLKNKNSLEGWSLALKSVTPEQWSNYVVQRKKSAIMGSNY